MSETPQDDESRPGASAPRVWLLLGEKPGDNAQIRNLADALSWPFEEKNIFVKPEWAIGKPRVRPNLDHLDHERTDPLSAPWPDFVITSGRRLSCVALWIKEASAGSCRIIIIGKQRGMRRAVDLLIVAAHYVIDHRPNVAQHRLPLMHVDPAALTAARDLWQPRLADLPRPLAAVMVGGKTGSLRLDVEAASDLLDKAIRSVEDNGGSLYITTSRRTPADVVEMLRRRCPESARLHVFDPDAAPADNPYRGLLALADHFIVTSDSISMMVEVVQLRRSLAIYPLERQTTPVEELLIKLHLLRRLSPTTESLPTGGLNERLLGAIGRPVHSKDMSAIPRLLVAEGWAGWLGGKRVQPTRPVENELAAIASRVHAMWTGSAG